jgi:hypothetical protein
MPCGYQIDLGGKGNRSLLLVAHEITTNPQMRFRVAIFPYMALFVPVLFPLEGLGQ